MSVPLDSSSGGSVCVHISNCPHLNMNPQTGDVQHVPVQGGAMGQGVVGHPGGASAGPQGLLVPTDHRGVGAQSAEHHVSQGVVGQGCALGQGVSSHLGAADAGLQVYLDHVEHQGFGVGSAGFAVHRDSPGAEVQLVAGAPGVGHLGVVATEPQKPLGLVGHQGGGAVSAGRHGVGAATGRQGRVAHSGRAGQGGPQQRSGQNVRQASATPSGQVGYSAQIGSGVYQGDAAQVPIVGEDLSSYLVQTSTERRKLSQREAALVADIRVLISMHGNTFRQSNALTKVDIDRARVLRLYMDVQPLQQMASIGLNWHGYADRALEAIVLDSLREVNRIRRLMNEKLDGRL